MDPQRPLCRQQPPAAAKLVFKGVLFGVWQWEQTLFDGRSAVFETLRRPDTVLVLPVLSDGDVLFAEESQPGVATVLQAIGGRIEPGETPAAAAGRELEEEAGYRAAELLLWDAWQPVSKIDWAVYLYVAHGLSLTSGPRLDAGERITVKPVRWEALLNQGTDLGIGDYELLHKVYYARSDPRERERVAALLRPGGRTA